MSGMPIDVSRLHIVAFPAPVLKARAKPVPEVNDEVRAVATRMLALMYEAPGIGLAAPQVGLGWRMFVLDVPTDEEEPAPAPGAPPVATDGPMVFINPVLSRPEGELEPMEEGCLSLPQIRGEVMRPLMITVSAQDQHGRSFELRAGGLLARCIQHEFDHLEGTLIIDRMTQASRLKVRAKVKSLEQGS
jgi:peptide deformylase